MRSAKLLWILISIGLFRNNCSKTETKIPLFCGQFWNYLIWLYCASTALCFQLQMLHIKLSCEKVCLQHNVLILAGTWWHLQLKDGSWCYFRSKEVTCVRWKKANIVVTSLAILGFLAYNFGIWAPNSEYVKTANATDITGPYCSIKEKYARLIHILNNIDTVVTLILPSFTITILNLQIIRAVTRINKDRRQVLYSHAVAGRQTSSSNNKAEGNSHKNVLTSFMSGQDSKKSSYGGHSSCSSPKIGNEKIKIQSQQSVAGQNRVTKMLLVVSTIFLLLNMPSHTIRIYFFIAAIINPNYSPPTIMLSLQKLFAYIYYINFSINFFLYSLCGNNFRKALWQLLNRPFVFLNRNPCTKRKARNSHSSGRARDEVCLTGRGQLKQVDSIVSYNNGKNINDNDIVL